MRPYRSRVRGENKASTACEVSTRNPTVSSRFAAQFPRFTGSGASAQSINVFAGEGSRILVAAPHGYKKDDLNTENLAHALARELQACMVINNQKYRKPRSYHPNDPEIQVLR